MQIVRIKYSVEDILSLKLLNSIDPIKLIEVLEIFHYHRFTFLTLERITFEDHITDIEQMIHDIFQPEIVQILERKGKEVLCFLKLHRDKGFWPKSLSGNWTIIPPIIIDKKYVKETLLIRDSFENVYKTYSKYIKNLEIIAINNVENKSELLDLQSQQILQNFQTFPHFSKRQNEIALYATRLGYYESPKKVSAEALAEKFNISISAINEHLRKAEQTAMKYFFS